MNKASGGDGIPVELFQILKDDAVKVLHAICQQIWKTQQCPQDWKMSVLFQHFKECSIYCIIALISRLAKYCSKFSKTGFNIMLTENFQMFKLDLGKAEEPDIKLPTSTGSSKKQQSSRKTSTSASLSMLNPLTVWITTNCKTLQKIGNTDYLTSPLKNLYTGQETIIRIRHGTMDWFQIGNRVYQGCILSPCIFNIYAEHIR